MSKASFKNFTVKANYKGDKKASWGDNWNNHLVTVTNTDNKKRCTFEFWSSIANPELNEEYDILNSFYTFVSDAVGSDQTFENFCGEYGYNEDSREAEKIYRKCQKSLEKLKRIYDGDIYDLLSELGENYA
jgi:hypothetical protein